MFYILEYCVMFIIIYIYIHIEVRGLPNAIFNPCVRWDAWPGLAKNSSAVAAVVVVALQKYKNKMEN